jgi:DNA-binding NarL/FixJ family response regulator
MNDETDEQAQDDRDAELERDTELREQRNRDDDALEARERDAIALAALREKGHALTPRQLQVAKLIALGLTNGEVALRMGVSSKTIDSHRSRVMAALGTRNNVELARLAIKLGLVDPP